LAGAPSVYCPPPRLVWEHDAAVETREAARRLKRWLRRSIPVVSMLGCVALAFTILRSDVLQRAGGPAPSAAATNRARGRYYLDEQELVRDRTTGEAVGMSFGGMLVDW
jgi:hypothetical protein